MAMDSSPRHRLHVDQRLEPGASAALDRDQAHYIVNVLRLGTGTRLLAFNGRDGEFEAELAEAAKKSATLKVVRQTRPAEAAPDLMLAFAPVKRARIDFIAEKATELGVGQIQPVMTEYTSVSRVNTDRMGANAVGAAEQAGRLTVPEVHTPVPFDRLLADWPKSRHLVFCDEGLSGKAGDGMIESVAGLGGSAAILIGPEGGFSPAERKALGSLESAVPVSLGPNILRSETAVVAALSIWQAAAGNWRHANGA